MKKVLLFGFGKQGKKYYNYFHAQGYECVLVTQRGGKRDIIEGQSIGSISFDDFKKSELIHDEYSYIVVAVSPISLQEEVILWVLTWGVHTPCIIEKPVAENSPLIEICRKQDNFLFYIDEYILSGVYKRILDKEPNTQIEIEVHDPYGDDSNSVYEHALAPFFSFVDFPTIFQDIHLHPGASLVSEKDILMYRVTFGKYILECQCGVITLNTSPIFQLSFESSLKYFLSLSKEQHHIIKNNFTFYKSQYHQK